jgi:hypothetical protein
MASPRFLPNPARIRDYLTAHRWRKGWDITGGYGEMFVFEEPADDGDQITVFVPSHDLWDDYRQRAVEVVDTLAAIERRTKEAVWADLCGTTAVASTPAAPAPAPPTPTDPVTP